MSTDLTQLYEFRVNDGRNTILHPTRRAAAKQVASLLRKNYDLQEIETENKVNGQWQHDEKMVTLATQYHSNALEKSNGKTVKSADDKAPIRKLMQACKLAISASPMTNDHMSAIEEYMQEVQTLFNTIEA